MSTLPDPFDGNGTNFVEKRFLDVANMHHQFDEVTAPRAVHDYRVVHFVGEDNTFNVCNLVHTMLPSDDNESCACQGSAAG